MPGHRRLRLCRVLQLLGACYSAGTAALSLPDSIADTLLLSRALAEIEPALADEILDEGRQHLLTAVDA